jgi:hypothetical protein
MKQIVVMPGGFHPFHAGHASLYQSALKAFPDADVYVAATNDQKTRPFPFAIKEKLAKVAGVAPGHFVQVKSPFKSEEITQKYNPDEDVLIFVRSEKDRNEQPKPGGIKKDGSPSYFQPWTGKNLQPFSKHAYIAYLPTIEFGPGIKSASEIRELWPKLNDKRKLAMVMSLYPATQKNTKLADNVKKLLDAGMGEQAENLSEYRNKVLNVPKTTNVYYKPRHGNKTYLIGKDVPGEHIDKFINLVKHKYADLRNAGKDEIFWNVEVKEEVSLDAITDAAAYIPNAINDYLQKAIAVYGQEAKESAQMVKLLPLMYAGKATPDQLKFIKDQFADIGNILGKQLKTLATGSITGPVADAISDSPVAQKIIDKTLDSLADIPEEKGLSKAENYFKNKFGFSLVGKVANLLKFETSSDVQYKQHQKADQAEINKQQATPQSQAVNKQVNTMRRQQHYAYEDVAKGKMKPMHVTGKEKPGAVETLEKALVRAKDRGIKLDYDKIDKMMQLICKEHNLTGDKLHNDFVKKHHMIPDNWIKKHSDVTESVDYLEEK